MRLSSGPLKWKRDAGLCLALCLSLAETRARLML